MLSQKNPTEIPLTDADRAVLSKPIQLIKIIFGVSSTLYTITMVVMIIATDDSFLKMFYFILIVLFLSAIWFVGKPYISKMQMDIDYGKKVVLEGMVSDKRTFKEGNTVFYTLSIKGKDYNVSKELYDTVNTSGIVSIVTTKYREQVLDITQIS